MRLTADTNVLLRMVLADDLEQQQLAVDLLEQADLVVVSTSALCEFAWVLSRTYRKSRGDIADAIAQLLDMRNIRVDRLAAAAGLAMLEAGGDFADGVIAHEGRWLGGEIFVSFDRKAVRELGRRGLSAKLLA